MNCKLCTCEIKGYTKKFHHFKINETCEVDICFNCIDKFTIWQGSIIRELFPTKTLKKRFK
jgi:hypothetical protein